MSYNRLGVNKPGQRASISTHGRGDPLDDQELVAAVRNGDSDAFRTLFERYNRRAYALAFGVLRHQDDALDVVQDAFIKAHKYLDKFEGNSSFYTWLYRIVMNLSIDHIRKHRRAMPVELDETRIEDEADDALLPRILGGNPARALVDKQIRARIDQALDELSDNHRSVLVMRELEGLSYEDMAQAMSCSKGTIMSRLFHARRNMQKRLLDLIDHPSAELVADLTGVSAEDSGDVTAHEESPRKSAPAARSR
jgi:RNA polymerase sigma-70 factor (ECF subfamily)